MRDKKGLLIVEAVVGSFLMLFAFIAAAQLFDASLRWETGSSNARLAALVAERRLEELKGWVDLECETKAFKDLDWTSKEVTDEPDPEDAAFLVHIRTGLPTYTQPRSDTGRGVIPPGLHSPSSQLYARAPAGQNAQKHEFWLTYPYSRDLSDSARLVQIRVTYGSAGQVYELVSLVGDPIAPAGVEPVVDFPAFPVVISGPNSIGTPSSTEIYDVQVQLPGGDPIDEVVSLWSLAPTSTGTGKIRALDPNGSRVEVTRSPLIPAGSSLKLILAARVRYRGQELIGYKEVNLP